MSQQDKLRQSLRGYFDNREYTPNTDDWHLYLVRMREKRRRRTFRFLSFGAAVLLCGSAIVVFNSAGAERDPVTAIAQKSTVALEQVPTPAPFQTPTGSTEINKRVLVSSAHRGTPNVEAVTVNTQPDLSENGPEFINPATLELRAAEAAIALRRVPVEIGTENAAKDALVSTTVYDLTGEQPEEKTGVTAAGQPPDSPISGVPVVVGKEEDGLLENKFNQPLVKNPVSEETGVLSLPEESANGDKAAADTLSASTEPIPDESLVFPPDAGLYVEAGAAWLHGWKGSTGYDGRGFTPIAGVGFLRTIDHQFAFSFGLSYTQVPRLAATGRTSRVSSYTFGEESKVTVITPSLAHYLQVPIRVHYYAARKHSFGAGVLLGYLLNVTANVTTFEQRPGFRGNSTTVRLGGYTEGFSTYDSQLSAFYRFSFRRGFALQGEYFFGFTDLKQDAFFGIEKVERNSGARLSVIYYPFISCCRR